MSLQVIQQFYNSTGMEEHRLEQDVFQLEKTRTQEIIQPANRKRSGHGRNKRPYDGHWTKNYRSRVPSKEANKNA